MLNCRSEDKSALKMPLRRSPILLRGTAIAFVVHVAMMYLPIGQHLLSTQPVSLETWMVLTPLSFSILAAVELDKWLNGQRLQTARNSVVD